MQRLKGLEEKRKFLRKTINNALEKHDLEWFEGKYDPLGRALDAEAHKTQAIWIREARDLTDRLLPWYVAGLGRKEYLADYDYWAKAPFFEPFEITLLSLGLEPVGEFLKILDPGISQRDDPASTFALRRLALIYRSFNGGSFGGKTRPAILAEWVNAVDLDVHPGFTRMLKNLTGFSPIGRRSLKVPASNSGSTEKIPEPREIVSMSKLLTAIAISEFGYDPIDKRSPIPREIQEIADLEGLGVSKDTIRKYLRTGAKYLPDGWKPNK